MALALVVHHSLAAIAAQNAPDFPRALSSYSAPGELSLFGQLLDRVRTEPFNLVATLLFFCAIAHTFIAPRFAKAARRYEREHQERQMPGKRVQDSPGRSEVSFKAEAFHFLGEVEAIFGIWVIPLLMAITIEKGWPAARDYLGHGLDFTEPLFVVVIMAIAASRPILELSERVMSLLAAAGKNSPGAWWLSILSVGPLLGSLITEPAAMTISALLLAGKFYRRKPNAALSYATLGLLFVNVSVGGTLTHFAAPPVLMVAGKWGWDLRHMLFHFGWKAMAGIFAANALYFGFFFREFQRLASVAPPSDAVSDALEKGNEPVPFWIMAVHILFLAWTVINNHYPVLFIGGFLFYLAFARATEHHQGELALRPALLVGFFLAGLVVHGGLQGWWIGPVLGRLTEQPLFLGAAILTAFNDNAAITYLASLVPSFSESLKYAVVAGAVTGGGLTVIANAPNPAGQSILAPFFPNGVSPLRLFLGAFLPTLILSIAFQSFR